MLRKSAPPRALVRISRPDAEVWLERLRSAGFCTVDELPADLLLVADEGADAAIAETSRSKHAPAVVVADASAERVEPLLRAGAWAVLEHGTSELRCERRLERLARCVRQSREVEFLRRLVNAAPDVVFAADREHRILYINTSDEYIGRSVFDFVPPHHHTVLAHSLERVFEHGEEASHIVAQADIEPTVWWSTRLAPITEHDEVTMVAVVARDITEAMRVERELKATKTELEQRVVERTDELMQINAALRAEIVERKRLEEELRAVASLKKIFANTVIEAQEQERKRVARELHDAIGQVLVALKMDADWIDDKLGGDSELTTVARDLSGKLGGCAVDVFPSEPKSNNEPFESELVGLPNTILTPHIGGSTAEAQENIGQFVPNKIVQYINTGSTTGSVNFPNVQLQAVKEAHRLLHIHHNVPNVLAQIDQILGKYNINILGQYLKTNEQIGYVITDVDQAYGEELLDELKKIAPTIWFRVLY